VKKYGGKPTDYLPIHDFFDCTKSAHASVKHRAVLHNALGIFIAERLFGVTITNSDGVAVSVRDIGEQHVLEDLGTIPSLDDWLSCMSAEPWMAGALKGSTTATREAAKRDATNARLTTRAKSPPEDLNNAVFD